MFIILLARYVFVVRSSCIYTWKHHWMELVSHSAKYGNTFLVTGVCNICVNVHDLAVWIVFQHSSINDVDMLFGIRARVHARDMGCLYI